MILGLERCGRAVKSEVPKSFRTGNSAFLIRVAIALAARVDSSVSVRRSKRTGRSSLTLPDCRLAVSEAHQ